MIRPKHPTLSFRRQCDLVGLNRSTFYWQPAGESPPNLALMRWFEQEYNRTPFYRYRKMTACLNHHHGFQVNPKRIAQLMRKMGLRAIYARPRTSVADQPRQKYPYLPCGLDIKRPNHVWAANITSVACTSRVHVPDSQLGLVQLLRRCLATLNTLNGAFCFDALRKTL